MKYSVRRACLIVVSAVMPAVIAVTALPYRSVALASSHAPNAHLLSLNEAAYWDLVRASREAVKKLGGAPQAHIQQELAGLAGKWQAVTTVEMEDGLLVPIDNGYLLGYLQAETPDLTKITEILDTLLAAHAAFPRRLFSIGDLDALHQVLSRPEFQWPEKAPNPLNEWFQRLVNRILHWLDRGQISVPALPLLPMIASIMLVLILIWVFRTLFNDLVGEAHLNGEVGGDDEPLDSQAAFEKAQAVSRGGDYRSAVRYLYLSSLLLLDERDILRYDRSKTNREYLRSVSNSPELAGPLSEVIEVFDDVWYGYHSLGEDSFKHYSQRVEELKEKWQ